MNTTRKKHAALSKQTKTNKPSYYIFPIFLYIQKYLENNF